MLYAPEGFAHGYQTLTDDTEMYYTTTAMYAGASARECASTTRRSGSSGRFRCPSSPTRTAAGRPINRESNRESNREPSSLHEASMTKKVLLTGASGFIGRHASRRCSPAATRCTRSRAELQSARATATASTWHRADLLEPGGAQTVARAGPAHASAASGLVRRARQADHRPGELRLGRRPAWICCSASPTRAASASTVCGSGYEYDWSYGYCSEKLTPAVPNTVYGVVQAGAQPAGPVLREPGGLSAAWGRVFFLYGPHEHPDRLVSSVIRSLLRREPAQLLARAADPRLPARAGRRGRTGRAARQRRSTGAVNVSSGQATTLREIVLDGRPPARAPRSDPAGRDSGARQRHCRSSSATTRALTAEIGWTPRYDLDSGLRQTIDWWQRQGG